MSVKLIAVSQRASCFFYIFGRICDARACWYGTSFDAFKI